MDEINYLNIEVKDNLKAVKDYIDKGYLNWVMLEAGDEDRLQLINSIYPNLILYNPMKVLRDFDNTYIAALRALGDKSLSLFEQLEDIRSGKIWKK